MHWSKKKAAVGASIILATAVVMLLAAGWYYSDEIKYGALVPNHEETEFDIVVAAVGDGDVTLRATSRTDRDDAWSSEGIWGLKTESGYARVGRVIERSEDEVVRELEPKTDGLIVGEQAFLDSFVFPGNPELAHGIPYENIVYSSSGGSFPAWFVDGPLDTWVVLVHGHNSDRREGLRMLKVLADLGHPTLLITYRNDAGVPASPDGYIRFGATEWQELEGAVKYAIENGADQVVPVGYSMGGGIVMSFLYQSSLVDRIPGVILDAPMLDFGGTIDFRASRTQLPVLGLPLPGILTDVAKYISARRFDIEWDELNYLGKTAQLKVPILLFHGDADPSVPIVTSDRLAQSRTDLVDYVKVPDTLHVAAWNTDPGVYAAQIADFLGEISQ